MIVNVPTSPHYKYPLVMAVGASESDDMKCIDWSSWRILQYFLESPRGKRSLLASTVGSASEVSGT